ncbi:heat-inducible transcriptional repressor HrcA [Clostridium transplantifaecale]|uniref:heat-inducible transcriptional repressor HrcA n=1 Tax=Clostridium transplantifaecale TaxID=2479838 RepID=UPI003C12C43F
METEKGCMQMELDERKVKILKAIIQTYLETGEPVGSRTISKYSDLQLSSATIRNEMSDLEELGFIVQPHTSAGRIPSDKGYRFYVDQLMKEKENEVTEMQELVIQRVDRVELLLKQLAKLLAVNTNYATMISGPQYHHTKLKFIQLSRVEAGKLLIVTVLEGNIIKNSIVRLDAELNDDDILNLNILLNNSLNGLTIEQINLDVISKMKEQAGDRRQVVDLVLNEVADAIRANEEDLQIYTEGTTNIFKYPELSDGQKASQLISTLEQKELLKNLFTDSEEDGGKNEIQVYIGNETPVQSMQDCSVVTANYVLGDGLRGTIGIIGPKRMDYEKVVSTLRSLMNQLEDTFKNEER